MRKYGNDELEKKPLVGSEKSDCQVAIKNQLRWNGIVQQSQISEQIGAI